MCLSGLGKQLMCCGSTMKHIRPWERLLTSIKHRLARIFGPGTISLRLRTLVLTTVTVGLVMGLSGCLLNRVSEVRGQLCEFDSNFELRFSDEANFRFNHPVLLDKDIVWLAGASPTEMNHSRDGLSMVYVIEKIAPVAQPENDIRLELNFSRNGDEFKLMNMRFDPKFNAILNPDVLDAEAISTAARTVCETGWNFASTSMEVDISDQDLESLPTRVEILEWLGTPSEQGQQDGSYTYVYRLKSDDPEPPIARITVWFDEAGEKPLRTDSRYSRFHTSTDFVQKIMTMKVDI